MTSVFIAGSITIKKLPAAFLFRLDGLITSGLHVLIGDANGVDKAVQSELLNKGVDAVTVYCTGDAPRNNLGQWPVRLVQSSARQGTRAYYTAKDLQMAAEADFGLMLWDAKSAGTLSNVVALTKQNKKCVVYVKPFDAFSIVRDFESLHALIDIMTDEARDEVEGKINLSQLLSSLKPSVQFGLPFP